MKKRYFLHLYELRIFSFDKPKNKIQFAEEIEIKNFFIMKRKKKNTRNWRENLYL